MEPQVHMVEVRWVRRMLPAVQARLPQAQARQQAVEQQVQVGHVWWVRRLLRITALTNSVAAAAVPIAAAALTSSTVAALIIGAG
jgi:hypothetical protein